MTPEPVDPRSFLPLTPLAFQVLLALAGTERHGYGILREVDERTDGLIRLRTGTLYTLLQRLLEESMIEEATAPAGEDERRKYYRLTVLGRDVLAAEARRLEALISEARRKQLLGRASPRHLAMIYDRATRWSLERIDPLSNPLFLRFRGVAHRRSMSSRRRFIPSIVTRRGSGLRFFRSICTSISRRPTTRRRARTPLGLMGRWRLADQVDTSHRFLFCASVLAADASLAAGARSDSGGRPARGLSVRSPTPRRGRRGSIATCCSASARWR